MKFVNDFFNQIKPTYDDNAVDRLNYWWTTVITAFFSLMIGGFQFGGQLQLYLDGRGVLTTCPLYIYADLKCHNELLDGLV